MILKKAPFLCRVSTGDSGRHRTVCKPPNPGADNSNQLTTGHFNRTLELVSRQRIHGTTPKITNPVPSLQYKNSGGTIIQWGCLWPAGTFKVKWM